ncbi:hypothetical protein B5T_02368 [Alloalcanivorax dieselolei B5]|uniref:Methyltransferase type 11 domain-containing protein n=1 Tax=Alcanivorax dieselolei (strain DSM 16502 / CGMCC 1.3690 / MCCC 1A00001 / B-5) TaxID=930169 RepID=K0CG09_ALCDB|nr:methyltransferase domain-containing protein [Alloalcanivorax dieselolei]AFT70642.1 hypothetical protein B5T_02368 [Alloalcanivorax dieselolei B5]GGJ85861.1 hypothetical protein GCM10007426_13770 [Alloalcanivorax dieselolei]
MQLPPLPRGPYRRHPQDMPHRFDRWLDSDAGRALLHEERELLADWLPRLVGQRAVSVGSCACRDMLEGIRIPWCCNVTPPELGRGQVQAQAKALPIAKNSVDVLLLHHGLEFQDEPHQVLREAAGCVAPGGMIAVVSFQPVSLLGLARWFRPGARRRPGWVGRYFTPYRVSDWLQVLGFEVEGLASGFHNLPLGERGRRRLAWLEWLGRRLWWRHGACYLLVARKRAAMVRPLAPSFRRGEPSRPTVISVPVARWQRNVE